MKVARYNIGTLSPKHVKMSGQAQTAAAEKMLRTVRGLFHKGNNREICLLQGRIDDVLNLEVNPQACAELAFIFARATMASSTAMLTPAIWYMQIAYSWYNEFAFINDTEDIPGDALAQKQLVMLCSILGRTYSKLGEYKRAEQKFAHNIMLRQRMAGGSIQRLLRLVPHILDMAQNMHVLGEHLGAINMLETVLQSISSTSKQRIGVILNHDSDEDDASDEDGDSNSAPPSPVKSHPSAPRVYLCPWLLMGNCFMALGRYMPAVGSFLHSRAAVKTRASPFLTASVDLNFAVVLWAREECLSAALHGLAESYRNMSFAGPGLPRNIVEHRLLQLLARACFSVQCRAGSLGLCVKLNANGHVTDVCEAVPNTPHMRELMPIQWFAVLEEDRDSKGFPVAMVLRIENIPSNSRDPRERKIEFPCKINSRPDSMTLPASKLWTFFDACLKFTEQGVPHQRQQSMLDIMESIVKAQQIAHENNLLTLFEDASFYLAFFVFQRPGACNQQLGIERFKHYIQEQVDVRNCYKCRFCSQHKDDMLKCGGCLVARFCETKHQKLATQQRFGSTTISHKKICPLLRMCRELTEHKLAHGDLDPGTLELLLLYDAAILAFLQTDIFEKYKAKYDPTFDGEYDIAIGF